MGTKHVEINYEKCKALLNNQWDECVDFLEGKDCNDIGLKKIAEKLIFFNVFLDFVQEAFSETMIHISRIKYCYRIVKEANDSNVDENRFIPNSNYATLNRMNDESKCYLYLSTDWLNLPRKEVIKTCLKECHIKTGDPIWGTEFKINKSAGNGLIVNLSSLENIPTGDVQFNELIEKKCKKIFELNPTINHREEYGKIIKYYTTLMYFKIWEESEIFAPTDKEKEKQALKQYKPFHFIADYFEKKGYAGIMFRSTVNKKCLNLVLFNTEFAECKIKKVKKINAIKYL